MFAHKDVSINNVPYRGLRECHEIRLPRIRIDGSRTARTVWGTEDVHAHDKIYVRIEESAIPYHLWPPFFRV